MATEQVVETVAEGLEEAAVITRRFNPKSISLVAGGIGIGLVVGFVIGYRWNRAKIRAEAFRESEKEVEQIRELYRNETAALKARQKPHLEEVIEDRGYSDRQEEPERPTRPPVPAGPPPESTMKLETGKDKDLHWEYPQELANRSPDRPYIIHQDEYDQPDSDYKTEVLTWWSGDDVLTGEDEQPMLNADDIVGLEHMSRFGHGTDDFNVLFIRNDRLKMEYEVCRMTTSYEEEIQGLSNDEPH